MALSLFQQTRSLV